jgi:choice-of-anchor B domain-containing protein
MTIRILLLTCMLALAGSSAPAAPVVVKRNMDVLSQMNDFPGVNGAVNYSACWAYVHGNGREFAALGVNTGTAIYEITVPTAPVLKAFIPGPPSVWREIKSYRNWIYVVSEESDSPLAGLQIIRMTNPDQPVLAATYATDFVESHTISIDTTRALLVCNGTKDAAGHELGMRILSLANPEAPVELARWPAGSGYVPHEFYVHDSVPVGGRLYASMLYSGMRIFDIANPSAPAEIGGWLYPGVFSHNSWPDSTGRWLYVTDEMTGEPLKIFDLADPANPVLVNGITSNPKAIVHNAHVKGRELYLSSYTEGVRVLDLSDPAHPAEFGWADPFSEPSGGYLGVWEVCPYLPSGNLIASDRQNGLYVLRPQRTYGIVEVQVQTDDSALTPTTCGLDGCSCIPGECACPGHNDPVPPGPEGAVVRLVALGDSLAAPADGIVRFAPFPGLAIVQAAKFGYESANGVAFVPNAGVASVGVTLVRRPATTLAGTLRAASDGVPVNDGEVIVAHTPLHVHSDSVGGFAFTAVPQDRYRIEAHAPGFVPIAFERDLGDAPTVLEIPLSPVLIRDRFEFPSGWSVDGAGDDATSGRWTRVEPLGTGEPDPALAAAVGRAAHGSACGVAANPSAGHCAAPGAARTGVASP